MDENTNIAETKPQDIVSSNESQQEAETTKKKERKSLSYEEKLKELDQKMEQLKARKRDLAARHSKEERKKRTKRLIEIGATVESVLGHPIEHDDLKKLEKFLRSQDERGNYFTHAMAGK